MIGFDKNKGDMIMKPDARNLSINMREEEQSDGRYEVEP